MKKFILMALIISFACTLAFAGTTTHSGLTGTELHQAFPTGLDASKPASPAVGDHYYATDTKILYECQTVNTWTQVIPDTTKVSTTGAETIAGVKTFSSFPVTPTSIPSTVYQVSNKKYVDGILVFLS